jgi:hypothetical protein
MLSQAVRVELAVVLDVTTPQNDLVAIIIPEEREKNNPLFRGLYKSARISSATGSPSGMDNAVVYPLVILIAISFIVEIVQLKDTAHP